MSFLSNLFGQEGSSMHTAWKILESDEQLDQLIRDSQGKPVGIFKHSTRCGVSSMAKARLESEWRFSESELDFYYLDLIRYRALSNRIAQELEIRHESPQVILLYQGKVIYHESHNHIDVHEMEEVLKEN